MLDIFNRVEQVERVGFSWRLKLELESGGKNFLSRTRT